MTAFAACLFTLAALVSVGTLYATLQRFGPGVLALRSQLDRCPATMTIKWTMVERVVVPALATLRKRPSFRTPDRPGLDWPTLEIAA